MTTVLQARITGASAASGLVTSTTVAALAVVLQMTKMKDVCSASGVV